MSRRDKRMDAYIAKSAPFAQPILEHVRAVARAGIGDAGFIADVHHGGRHRFRSRA